MKSVNLQCCTSPSNCMRTRFPGIDGTPDCSDRRIVQQGSGRTCLLSTHIICSDYLFNISQSRHVNVLPTPDSCPPPSPTLHKPIVSRNSVSFLVSSNGWICLIYSIRGIFPMPIWTHIELTVAFSFKNPHVSTRECITILYVLSYRPVATTTNANWDAELNSSLFGRIWTQDECGWIQTCVVQQTSPHFKIKSKFDVGYMLTLIKLTFLAYLLRWTRFWV